VNTPYRFDSCVKDLDVEEIVDLHFHRRLAFWLVIKPIEKLGLESVTPMKLTLTSIAIGVLAGIVSGMAPEYGLSMCVVGAAMLLVHVILDCSDGMLARLRGGGSNLGMLVDGLGDGIVGVAYWAGLARTTASFVDGPWVWPALIAILVSIATHTSLYDNVKNKFVAATAVPNPAPASTPAPPAREPSDFEKKAEVIIERIYRAYAGAGVALASGDAVRKDPTIARALLRPAMRSVSAIGLGTSLFTMYVAAALMPIWPTAPLVIGLVGLAGIGNVVMVVALIQWKRGERALEAL